MDKYPNLITDIKPFYCRVFFYRDIVAGNKDFYLIEKYKGSDKYSSVMKDAPCTVALGSMVFFLSLGIELSKTTLGSLLNQQQTSKEDLLAKGLEKNGDGINQFTDSLKEILQDLKISLN